MTGVNGETNQVHEAAADFPRVAAAEIGRGGYSRDSNLREKNRSYLRSFLHTYSGSPFIEDLWDWIDEMEDYFVEMQSPERLKCKIASYTLEEEADRWWCELEHHRFSWWRMKHLMAEEFIHARRSMKCPLEDYNNSWNQECKHDTTRGFYSAMSVAEMKATSEIAKHTEQTGKQRKSSLDDVSVRQRSKELVEGKPANNEMVEKNSTAVHFETDNTPKYGAATPASTFEEEFGCEQPPQLQHLATIVVQNILVAKGADGNEGSVINYTMPTSKTTTTVNCNVETVKGCELQVTSLEDTHVLVKGITTGGQEVEIELNTPVKIEVLDDVAQANNAYHVLMDVPKLDLLLKCDSPIHVLLINPSKLETMMLKVLIKSSVEKYNSMVSKIGKESGGVCKVGNAKEEQSRIRRVSEPYFMNGGTLYFSFDPGGHGLNEARQRTGSQATIRFVEICNLELTSSAAATGFEGNMRAWTVLHNPYCRDNVGSPYTYSFDQGDAVSSYLKRFPRNYYGVGLPMFLVDPGETLPPVRARSMEAKNDISAEQGRSAQTLQKPSVIQAETLPIILSLPYGNSEILAFAETDRMVAEDSLQPLTLELLFHIFIPFDPGGIACLLIAWNSDMVILEDKVVKINILCFCLWIGNSPKHWVSLMLVILLHPLDRSSDQNFNGNSVSVLVGLGLNYGLSFIWRDSNELVLYDQIIMNHGQTNMLHQVAVGQDHVAGVVLDINLNSRAGLGKAQQMTGLFIFLGSTFAENGDYSKALVQPLFDDDKLLVLRGTPMYVESHSVAHVIRAPSRYLDHAEDGQLSEDMKKQSYNVVVSNDVEKTYSIVVTILLLILSRRKGRYGSNEQAETFKKWIFMTSICSSLCCPRSTISRNGYDPTIAQGSKLRISPNLKPVSIAAFNEIGICLNDDLPSDISDLAKVKYEEVLSLTTIKAWTNPCSKFLRYNHACMKKLDGGTGIYTARNEGHELNVIASLPCLLIICDNGQFRGHLKVKVFFKLVNGLDPPNVTPLSYTAELYLIKHRMTHQLNKNNSRTSLSFRGEMELM